jgi:hypothetical protein
MIFAAGPVNSPVLLQVDEVIWNGKDGTDIFFENEMPYDPTVSPTTTSPRLTPS